MLRLCLFGPVFERKTGNAGEFPDVICDKRETQIACVGGDEHVVGADQLAAPLKICANQTIVINGFPGEIEHGYVLKEDQRSFPVSFRLWRGHDPKFYFCVDDDGDVNIADAYE